MRNIFLYLIIVILTFGMVIHEASAKRFGGGRSFGVQRSPNSLMSPQVYKNKSTVGKQTNTSKWGGILGGLLIGGLLASLFMGNGLGSALLSWLAVGLVIFFVVGLMRRKMNPGWQSVQSSVSGQTKFNGINDFLSSKFSDTFANVADEFKPEGFLREAKVTFLRLQAAYDQKNKEDLMAFTSPQMFAEIEMQLKERGDEPNRTEVIDLEAQLLDLSEQTNTMLASIRFTGFVKENNDLPVPLDEIWHFRQVANSKDWVVDGIQQEIVEPK